MTWTMSGGCVVIALEDFTGPCRVLALPCILKPFCHRWHHVIHKSLKRWNRFIRRLLVTRSDNDFRPIITSAQEFIPRQNKFSHVRTRRLLRANPIPPPDEQICGRRMQLVLLDGHWLRTEQYVACTFPDGPPMGLCFRYEQILGVDQLCSLLLVTVVSSVKIHRPAAAPVILQELGGGTDVLGPPVGDLGGTGLPLS